MKYLHLLRHSKSDWGNPTLSDRERPLAERGRKNARSLGKYMKKTQFSVDAALLSPSIRTKETFYILEKFQTISKDTRIINEIYAAESSELLKIIYNLRPNLQSVLLVGHNPGLEVLAQLLLFGEEDGSSSFEKFPTSSFLSLGIDSEDWKDWGSTRAKLIRFWIP